MFSTWLQIWYFPSFKHNVMWIGSKGKVPLNHSPSWSYFYFTYTIRHIATMYFISIVFCTFALYKFGVFQSRNIWYGGTIEETSVAWNSKSIRKIYLPISEKKPSEMTKAEHHCIWIYNFPFVFHHLPS